MIRKFVLTWNEHLLLYKQSTELLKITNIVATADLKQSVDITRFNEFLWGRYDYENNYNGRVGYVKDRGMQGRVTVFTTGKLISTGAKSAAKSEEQLRRTMKVLAENKFIKEVKLEPKIRNVVATLDLQNAVDLNLIASVVPQCIFEPEQFPALIHKIGTGATCLIFASGKVVITGATSEEQILITAETLAEKFKNFKIKK